MGVNRWGVSPLSENRGSSMNGIEQQRPAKGKGGLARDRLKEALRQTYWRLSKTLATQSGMTNQWLAEQGLVSIKTLWVAFHYPPKAAKG